MARPRDTRLFVLLVLSAIVWCSLACALGPWRGLWSFEERQISRILGIWEEFPIAQHLFLPFYTRQNFIERAPYTHFPPPFLGLLYGYLRLVQGLLDVPIQVAQNFVFLPYIGLLCCLTGAEFYRRRFGASSIDLRSALVIFIASGVVFTNASLWTGFTAGNVNFHALAAILFLGLGALAGRSQLYTASSFRILLALALLAPLYSLMALLVLAIVYEARAEESSPSVVPRTVVRAGVAILAVSLCVAFLPKAVFYLSDAFAREGGSSFLKRSGLNGDARYFDSLLGAMLDPYPGSRRSHVLHMPLLAACMAASIFFFAKERASLWQALRTWIVSSSPYILTMIFFAQALSIHPYLFDVFLTGSCGFVMAMLALDPAIERRLKGYALLIWFFAGSGVIMTNLIDISRAWASFR